MNNGDAYLYEYKRSEGTVVVDRIRDDLQGVEERYRGSHRKFSHTVEPFYLAGNGQSQSDFFFTYNSSVGADDPNAEVLVYDNRGGWNVTTGWQGTWRSNWTILKPFYIGDTTYLFEYRPPLTLGNATVTIDRVRDWGNGFDQAWSGEWANDWKVAEPFYLNNNTYLLLFKGQGAGEVVAIEEIKNGGAGTAELFRGEWSPAGTIVKIFYKGGSPYVFSYNPASPGGGDWMIHKIRTDLKGLNFVAKGEWLTGGLLGGPWQTIEPFYKNGKIYLVACDYTESLIPSSSSEVAFVELKPDLKGLTTVWRASWKKGWTHIKPFYFPPNLPPVQP